MMYAGVCSCHHPGSGKLTTHVMAERGEREHEEDRKRKAATSFEALVEGWLEAVAGFARHEFTTEARLKAGPGASKKCKAGTQTPDILLTSRPLLLEGGEGGTWSLRWLECKMFCLPGDGDKRAKVRHGQRRRAPDTATDLLHTVLLPFG